MLALSLLVIYRLLVKRCPLSGPPFGNKERGYMVIG